MANEALIKLTEEKINSNTELSRFIDKAKTLTIPLFPETVSFTDPALKFGAALVHVSTELDNFGNNRDIYKNETGGYCLHLSKLNEISQTAGIQIIDSRILERKVDESGKITFIEHQVRGHMKSIDGSIKELVTTGKYDYFRDVEKFMKPGETDKYGKPKGEGQVRSRRSHAEAISESNAISRLYNKMNCKLPSNFTLEELKKPFLVPFVIEDREELLKDFTPEEQKEIRKKIALGRLNVADAIYQTPQQLHSSANVTAPDREPVNPKRNDNVLAAENVADAQIVEEQKTFHLSPAEENKIKANEFRDSPQAERTKTILTLITKTGWKHPKGQTITQAVIEKAPIDTQLARIEELLNLQSEGELSL